MSEVSANQKDGSGLGSVTRATSANLVTAATSGPPIGDAVPESDAQASEGEPLTSDDRGGSRLPHAAGLIAKVIPFDRATLEHAVDQFFDQLEDLGVGQLPEPGLPRVLPLTLTVIAAVAGAEIARRRLRVQGSRGRDARRRDPIGSEDLLGFPELPGSWSTRVT